MAAGTPDDLGFRRSPRGGLSEHTSKKSSTNATTPGDLTGTSPTTSAVRRGTGSASAGRQSVQNETHVEAEQGGREDTSAATRKPTCLLGADGRPLPILKGNRQFGYAQARRLAEHLRVKFAVDRNETRFYCPDSNEHTEPPPAPAELRSAVRGFLKSSKKAVQESQELTQAAQRQLIETKEIEEQLAAMTQEYVEKLQYRKELQKAKQTQQTVVVAPATQPPRRRLCCGGTQLVLP